MTNFLKKIWKWVVGIIIGGIVIAAGTSGVPVKDPVLAMNIDGQQVRVEYTDENKDEGLIIRTTKSDYFNFAGTVELYFSIHNSTEDDQNVKIVFSFPKTNQPEVWEYDGEETIYTPQYHPASATSSEYTETITSIKTKWKGLPQSDFTANTIVRKDVKGAIALKENTAFIKSGETKSFKANVKYLNQGKEEFFIEAFGDKGDYGMIDPWVYEQLFNGLADGNLAGQDSWIEDTGIGSGVVGNYTPYEGAKNTRGFSDVVGFQYRRELDSAFSGAGTVYFVIRVTTQANLGGSGYCGVTTRSATQSFYLRFCGDGNLKFGSDGDGFVTLLAGYTNGQEYPIKVEFDLANNRAKAAYWDGSWQAWSAWRTNDGQTQVTKINWSGGTEVLSTYCYLDTITPTDPIPVTGGGGWELYD